MSKVAEILSQMAQNAGQAARYRGALIGGTIEQAANLPAQIYSDKQHQQALDLHTAQVNQQMGLEAARANRENQVNARADTAQNAADLKEAALKGIIGAGFAADPSKFDLPTAITKAHELGAEDLIPTVMAVHEKMQPKLTSGAPGSVMRNEAGQVVPGSQIPALPSTASNEVEKRRIYAKQASGAPLTPEEDASLKGFAAEAGVNDAPTIVKTVQGGKNVEIPMTRAQMQDAARAGTTFPSQPPASVTVNAALAGAANQPASAAEKAIARYDLPPISPRSMQTPAGKAMMDRILTENPDYDASLYSVRAPTRKAYTTGPQGQQLTAMNTAIEHLDQLQAAADALKNGNFKPGNRAFNYLKDLFGSGAPTSFATIKEKVDKELDAVASKGVPTVSGAAAQKEIGGAPSSPEAIKAYIDTSIKLLGSSQNALRAPYQRAMGANAPFDPLTPEAKAILLKRGFDPENPTGSTTSAAPVAALPPPAAGRIRIVGPNGQSGTILSTDPIPAGWTKQ